MGDNIGNHVLSLLLSSPDKNGVTFELLDAREVAEMNENEIKHVWILA